eukprot:scaffold2767_cov177-Amphora_coffeaeformis.AAC.98
MSNRLPPMEEGEAALLRSMESSKPSLTKRTTSNASSGAASGTKPTIYDALHDPGQEAAGAKPKTKPSFARLVRKIMTEQQKVQSGEPTPGHTRSKSTLQVQNLLREIGERGGSDRGLDDVFQQEIFHPGNIEFQTKPPGTEPEPGEEEALEAEMMAELDDVEQPQDTTPLLQNDGDAIRRLKNMRQGRTFCDGAAIKAFLWGWKIYSMQADSGLYILSSEPYLRMLICMIVAGAATALKRTFLAISFGRRQYSMYKPKLEKLLLDVVLLNEVASLSAQAEAMHEEISQESSQKDVKEVKKKDTGKRKTVNDVKWSSVKMTSEDINESSEHDETTGSKPRYGRSSSGGTFMKSLLDRWEEPVTVDKTEATIEDVLRFRRALAFMDQTHPFGEDFGLASTRDEAILSAEDVYRKLCKLELRNGRLPFDAIALVALQDDESYDVVKKRAIRRLFHPDKDGSLTMLAFVQSCDTLYRRLRYFVATVNNSASLDNVLENVFNSFFYFVLALLLLSLMNFNAWSLLVSMTSLLVSFSFAFGNTVSKYVQGVILIAVTRPFDLGDRIFLTSVGDVEKGFENAQNGWFVEDITLSATKLRFARTGEIAYLANNLLADMRIYNANRSPNANVVLIQMFHISILDKDNLKKFEEALRKFVEDRPRMWVELSLVVLVRIDNDMEQVFVQFVFRHRDSWQNVGRIYVHKAELLRFIQDTSKRLKIIFESPPPRRVLYYGGDLDQGAIVGEEDHRKDLLRAQNVRSNSGGFSHRPTASTGSLPPPYNQMGTATP